MSNETQNKSIAKTASAPKQRGPTVFIILVFLILGSLIVGGLWLTHSINEVNYVTVKIGSETFKLEIADTHASREKGLSERDSLGDNNGMLFVFPSDDEWAMWMLQMRFPIDIVWLDQSKTVVGIKQNATPGSYPEAFRPDMPSRYVIELPAGTVSRLSLKTGDRISW